VVAAALAGYGAINLSALLAAIEFGIQPMLFHDASGAPLYAPYPLRIAIPAMMIGHLTIAGIAEALMCAGLFTYLRRNEPALLHLPSFSEAIAPRAASGLWATLAVALLLTPLGILAGGAAWGEWAAKDYSTAAARAQIAAVSGAAPPAAAPSGLARLATLWTAPITDYAPHIAIKSAAFSYLLSAIFGVGLILSATWIVQQICLFARQRRAQ
jgi:cobalt/nickel transport system permease protein